MLIWKPNQTKLNFSSIRIQHLERTARPGPPHPCESQWRSPSPPPVLPRDHPLSLRDRVDRQHTRPLYCRLHPRASSAMAPERRQQGHLHWDLGAVSSHQGAYSEAAGVAGCGRLLQQVKIKRSNNDNDERYNSGRSSSGILMMT